MRDQPIIPSRLGILQAWTDPAGPSAAPKVLDNTLCCLRFLEPHPNHLSLAQTHNLPARLGIKRISALLTAAFIVLTATVVQAQPDMHIEEVEQAEAPKEAQNFWESIYDPNRPEYVKLVDVAWGALESGEFEAFEQTTGQLAAMKPDGTATLYYQAILSFRKGGFDKSIVLLDRALASEDFQDIPAESIHFDMALSLTRLGKIDDAIESYERALDTSSSTSNHHVYLANLSELLMAKGELDRAVMGFRESLSVQDDYLHAMMGLAAAMERKGQHTMARAYILQALNIDPELEAFFGTNTFFVPTEDETFYKGMIAEEQGRWKQAKEHYTVFVKQAESHDNPYKSFGQAALARLGEGGDPLVGKGKLPLERPTAVAVDPKGRYIALGNESGELAIIKLSTGKPVATLSTGARVNALAFRKDGALLVGRENRTIDVVNAGRGAKVKKSIAVSMRSGNRVHAISRDGEAFLAAQGRSARSWGLGLTDSASNELGQLAVAANAIDIALGPWNPETRSMVSAFWTQHQTLMIRHGLDVRETFTFRPPSAMRWNAVALTPNGRHAIVVGQGQAVVCRVADMQFMRLVSLSEEPGWGPPIKAVVDPQGAAGHGPALLVFYKGHYSAHRLDAMLPQ